ncbi:hypothetical protein HOU02_gp106 [Caulobacter phage CcrBL9]|uniref:Uncharacterized protein n=1 Tax=Caulobacter phage CcrBL9 TaxID=2283270 RepID=A0A385EBU7_9CAUD|nr:hypothetical protein HOU02_gp106 [Caulobacter phage CcrBL9]AXQ69130.1 hypothetical protein CcrBL9_gp106 [Caulobacter phage CcrBL9]
MAHPDDIVACPYCTSINTEAHFEDHPGGYGGHIQVGPYSCFECDAVEMSPYEDYPEATAEEKQKFWLRGTV